MGNWFSGEKTEHKEQHGKIFGFNVTTLIYWWLFGSFIGIIIAFFMIDMQGGGLKLTKGDTMIGQTINGIYSGAIRLFTWNMYGVRYGARVKPVYWNEADGEWSDTPPGNLPPQKGGSGKRYDQIFVIGFYVLFACVTLGLLFPKKISDAFSMPAIPIPNISLDDFRLTTKLDENYHTNNHISNEDFRVYTILKKQNKHVKDGFEKISNKFIPNTQDLKQPTRMEINKTRISNYAKEIEEELEIDMNKIS
jgi:hypothetical protein